ncbi:DUF349 domain-containing protein [Sesbania bispinosa]|nr:DUF349 domain-containing protein [Sesbania bispinosa]
MAGHHHVRSSRQCLATVCSSSRPASFVVLVFVSGGVFISGCVSSSVRRLRDCVSSSMRLSVSPPNRSVVAP